MTATKRRSDGATKGSILLALLVALTVHVTAAADVILGIKLEVADFSGYVVPEGMTLDLGGETITITKPIRAGKGSTIRNGRIDGPGLDQHKPCIEVMHGVDNVTIENITCSAGSYNGLAVLMGERARVLNCTILPGTGWGVKILEGDGAQISGLKTRDLRRGGIYIGDDDRDDDNFSDDVTIDHCVLDGADEEAVFRANNALHLTLHDNVFINTRSKSKKECAQFRGGSGVSINDVYLASIATGQTPVGRPILAQFKFVKPMIYGYVLSQAGSDIEITSGEQWMTPTLEYQGVKYTLANGGGGYALSAKGASNLLPAAKLIAKDSTIIGAKYLTAGRAKTSNVKTRK